MLIPCPCVVLQVQSWRVLPGRRGNTCCSLDIPNSPTSEGPFFLPATLIAVQNLVQLVQCKCWLCGGKVGIVPGNCLWFQGNAQHLHWQRASCTRWNPISIGPGIQSWHLLFPLCPASMLGGISITVKGRSTLAVTFSVALIWKVIIVWKFRPCFTYDILVIGCKICRLFNMQMRLTLMPRRAPGSQRARRVPCSSSMLAPSGLSKRMGWVVSFPGHWRGAGCSWSSCLLPCSCSKPSPLSILGHPTFSRDNADPVSAFSALSLWAAAFP